MNKSVSGYYRACSTAGLGSPSVGLLLPAMLFPLYGPTFNKAFQLPSMLGHAAAFMATQRKLSAVQSSCWYLDWPSQLG